MTADQLPFVEDEDHAALRKLARDVAERELAPNAAHWDETEEFAESSLEALRQAELFSVTIGEQYGGMGMGDIEAAIVLEELARVDVSCAILCQLVFNGPPQGDRAPGQRPPQAALAPARGAGEPVLHRDHGARCRICRHTDARQARRPTATAGGSRPTRTT